MNRGERSSWEPVYETSLEAGPEDSLGYYGSQLCTDVDYNLLNLKVSGGQRRKEKRETKSLWLHSLYWQQLSLKF